MRLFRDQDYTIRFLKGLNEEYSHVKSQIMMMEPFPPIAKAFSLVIQQERQLHTPSVEAEFKELVVDSGKVCAVNSNQFSNRGRGNYYNRGGRGRQGPGGRGQ